jgi:large subunit ribosomal protein L22
MEIKARARFIRISPFKVRLVAREISGKMADEALALLRFLPQRGARVLRKVLEAAVANAEQRPQVDVDTLFIKGIQVDGGPVLKRFMPRAMGRVNRILKRSSHITVVLDEKTGKAKTPQPKKK